MKTWLLIDANYLCHRALYTTGGLSHEGVGTGIVYGFLRAVEQQRDLYQADKVIFAFDSPGPGKRAEILPGYKSSRRKRHADEDETKLEERKEFYRQIDYLERDVLPRLGYRNVFSQRGYEADDVIAWWCDQILDQVIIVTADEDLWQCLRWNVLWHNPRTGRTVTAESFRKEWGVFPAQWAMVKALAGCSTDDVVGVKGIGNKFAAQWFAGTLKPDSAAHRKINEGLDVIGKNMELVRLPFPGCGPFWLRNDDVTKDKQNEVFAELGFQSRSPGRAAPVGFGLGR